MPIACCSPPTGKYRIGKTVKPVLLSSLLGCRSRKALTKSCFSCANANDPSDISTSTPSAMRNEVCFLPFTPIVHNIHQKSRLFYYTGGACKDLKKNDWHLEMSAIY